MANLYLNKFINDVLQKHFPDEYDEAIKVLSTTREKEAKARFITDFDKRLRTKASSISSDLNALEAKYRASSDVNLKKRIAVKHKQLSKDKSDIADVVKELPRAPLKANVGLGSKMISKFKSAANKTSGGRNLVQMAKDGIRNVYSDVKGSKGAIKDAFKELFGGKQLKDTFGSMHAKNFRDRLNRRDRRP